MILKPHQIFAFFSLIMGVILVFIIPPIGITDESQHARRGAEIAELIFVNADNHTEIKLALWAENCLALHEDKLTKTPRWNFPGLYSQLAELPQTPPAERQVTADKNPYGVHNPLPYAPYSVAVYIADYLGLPVWQKFYLMRMIGLLSVIGMITIAIKKMPAHNCLLAAFCLLPAMLVSRSGINIDGISIAASFLFISQVFYLSRKHSKASGLDIFLLILFAFIMAQTKAAYTPILLLAILIPSNIFTFLCQRIGVLFVVIIPSLAASFVWSTIAKTAILAGMRYINDNGEVWPDGQVEWMITHPVEYGMILFKTIFSTPALPNALFQIIGAIGWGGNNITIPAISYGLILALMIALMATEPVKKLYERSVLKNCFILMITGASFCLILTMLYIHWSDYQSPVIDGLLGRYLYPLLPLLAVFVRPITGREDEKLSIKLLWIFGFISSASTLWGIVNFYYL